MSELRQLIEQASSPARTETLFRQLQVEPQLCTANQGKVSRALLAQALNMLLFEDLMQRVPIAQTYVQRCLTRGRKIMLDHGALRTVLWPSGALPAGESAITRVLKPLGYELADVYPLPKLKMTGRAYRHVDFPQAIAQFFVSELHPEQFSSEFQTTVTRVLASSHDPLTQGHQALLQILEQQGFLSWSEAIGLLPALLACFSRQHDDFSWSDYQTLLNESAEMAWIATEGNVFNHATDRVPDLAALVSELKAEHYPLKATIEVSANGRVQQTAVLAVKVSRTFQDDSEQETQHYEVPGSFFEFIQREVLPDTSDQLDLSFDTGNATGIFQVTRQ
jgi:hypothetical protein